MYCVFPMAPGPALTQEVCLVCGQSFFPALNGAASHGKSSAISQPRKETRNSGRLYRLAYAVELHIAIAIAITITTHHMFLCHLDSFPSRHISPRPPAGSSNIQPDRSRLLHPSAPPGLAHMFIPHKSFLSEVICSTRAGWMMWPSRT
jgi:hypothetical protein